MNHGRILPMVVYSSDFGASSACGKKRVSHNFADSADDSTSDMDCVW